MSKFQIIILSIFIIFLVAGVIAFATFKGGTTTTELPAISVWGTFPQDTFDQYVTRINTSLSQQIKITYTYKRPEDFSADFISALARGMGPDAILISADSILLHADKILPIPYSSFPQRDFMDTFIQEGNMYIGQNGLLGIPFTIDPLVMYWNRETFDAAGIATTPRYWDEFANINKKITVKDDKGNIRKSALALGDFGTITHARELLGALFLQVGNPVTMRDADGWVVSALKGISTPRVTPALEFFTKAVDPSNPTYSWNRSMPESKTAFLSGILATYFGFASELSDIRAKNQNISFDVTSLPQLRTGGQKATYGRMFGFSIVRSSLNPGAAYQVISILTAPQFLTELSSARYLPSVRRDIIGQGSDDPYISIFNEAALISKSWLDTDPVQSQALFKNMIENITSGQSNPDEAARDASDQYDVLLQKARN
jgi:ABC-type glycerol-3-phosphate transport system substrate-binding protein